MSALAAEEAAVLAAAGAGDASAFAALAERYRAQLHLHCYRMLGSVDDAEDLVQETLLRAWRSRDGFEGRAMFRTWLYRIATNACLNVLERGPRRVMPQDVVPPVTATTDTSEARSAPSWAPEIPWLQPYPEHLLAAAAAPHETEPEAEVVSRETIELVYLAAIQHLPPRQRAILILRDALDWSAKETAALLETSLQSVNSALQRARSTLRTQLPTGRNDWAPAPPATEAERSLLQGFMGAWERADAAALIAMLREDARLAMPPAALWFDGRASIARLFQLFPMNFHGDVRMVPTTANRQPAAVTYLRPHGQSVYGLTALNVLRMEHGAIAEITTFSPALLHAFHLPPTL